jgi:hypothetical protein
MRGLRNLSILLLVSVAISASFGACWREPWSRYAEDEKGGHFYSPRSVERKDDGTVTLSGRVVEKRGWFTSIARFHRYSFNCEGRRYIRYVEGEIKRSGCSRETSGDMRRAKEAAPLLDVQPGSTVEKLFDIVCGEEE